MGRNPSRAFRHRCQLKGQLAPAAKCARGILTRLSEFNADAATLKLICHRVSAGLTEKILVAANLVTHSPVTMVSDWGQPQARPSAHRSDG